MKYFLLFLISITYLELLSQPPGGFNPEEMVMREKESVLDLNGLNRMQKELLNGIYKEYSETISETFQEIRKTRNFGEMRTKMSSLQEEKNLLIKDVLSDDQYQKYLDLAGNSMRGRQKREDG